MAKDLDPEQFAASLLSDPEFLHRLFGFEGILRITALPVELDVVVEPGKAPVVRPQSGEARLEVAVPSDLLAQARQQVRPFAAISRPASRPLRGCSAGFTICCGGQDLMLPTFRLPAIRSPTRT
jgi:hypothetical protein